MGNEKNKKNKKTINILCNNSQIKHYSSWLLVLASVLKVPSIKQCKLSHFVSIVAVTINNFVCLKRFLLFI